ncbi:small cysteine and glycine repeat-containing protein 2-like [Palaemon carinicauda]|uniref:small cysteine and glycine repeat-containing protein 2-like n=1 Tax=Palaemon carinicauda TaxID=392227 RepID=UPI0035B5CC58
MSKWVLFVSLLVFHRTQAALEYQKPLASSDETTDDLQTGVENVFSSVAGKALSCYDSGCDGEGGTCGEHQFSACKYKSSNLCKGFLCTCCVPCGGDCGGSDDGTCRATCESDEHSIDEDRKCGSFRCKCCKKNLGCSGSCGSGGTCKEKCDSVSEDEISGQCSEVSCKCCKPKPTCNGRCGRKNKFLLPKQFHLQMVSEEAGYMFGESLHMLQRIVLQLMGYTIL